MVKFQRFLKNNSSTILSIVASIGVIGTAILSGKGTYDSLKAINKKHKEKAPKKEKIKIAAPYYIPSLITGVATIVCISSANILNKKQQASLASACALLGESYRDYKDKVKELHGEEANTEIISSIASENFPEGEIPENKVWFYEETSKRFFESTKEDVLSAIYHFNRNFQLRGCASLNEFYDFLGLDNTDYGDVFGFSSWEMVEGGMTPWIDISTIKAQNCSGEWYYIISIDWEPVENYEDWEPSY